MCGAPSAGRHFNVMHCSWLCCLNCLRCVSGQITAAFPFTSSPSLLSFFLSISFLFNIFLDSGPEYLLFPLARTLCFWFCSFCQRRLGGGRDWTFFMKLCGRTHEIHFAVDSCFRIWKWCYLYAEGLHTRALCGAPQPFQHRLFPQAVAHHHVHARLSCS